MALLVIKKDRYPIKTQIIMDAMPNSFQGCTQIVYFGNILSELNYFFEHDALACFAFLIQFLFGNILEHADRSVRNAMLISQFDRGFKYPMDFAIACSNILLRFPYRAVASANPFNRLRPIVFC